MKKRKREINSPKTIIHTKRRSRRIQETIEAVQGTTNQLEELQNSTEQTPGKNVQEIGQIE
jgi:hypothetical protein